MRNWQEDMDWINSLLNSQVRSVNSIAGRIMDIADYWLKSYRELEAEAAAMREVLGAIKFPGFMGWMLPDDYKFATGITAKEFRTIFNALSSTAGQALLDRLANAEHKLAGHGPEGHNYTNMQYMELKDRLQKAEAVVEAAKALDIDEMLDGEEDCTCLACQGLRRLKQALADMEGVAGDSV